MSGRGSIQTQILTTYHLVAEFISKNVYTFGSIRDHTIPKSLKCSNSTNKTCKFFRSKLCRVCDMGCERSCGAGFGEQGLMVQHS